MKVSSGKSIFAAMKLYFFEVRVKASMKRTLYKVFLKISRATGDISAAACTCPAGVGLGGYGNCNHVDGFLLALEDFNRKGLQTWSDPVSCTSTLSSWNTNVLKYHKTLCPKFLAFLKY